MDHSYTIMIVDDSVEDRYLLKRYLQKTELPLVMLEAGNGLEGIALLKTPIHTLATQFPGISVPMIIFLDINMPMMNGWEFLDELERSRNQTQLQPTMILMHSTSDDNSDKIKAQQYCSVASYIVKGESTPDSLKHAILSHSGVM